MINYVVITENDTSEWKDKTGQQYHFPHRYLKYLQPDARVIYYKGKLRDKKFESKRLSKEPHYFGTAVIDKTWLDMDSDKKDHFASLKDFIPFTKPVLAKINNQHIEVIPESRLTNYWKDGVRLIDEKIFDKIIRLAESGSVVC